MTSLFKAVALVALLALASGASSSADDNFCQGCRSLISFASQFNRSSEREQNSELFQKYCEQYYPASTDFQAGPCPLFVEALFYVLDHVDPVQHCDQIGACDPTKGASLPSDDIYEYLKKSNNNEPQPLSKLRDSDGPVCEFCEQLVRQAKDVLKDPALIDQIKQQMDGFCEYLRIIDQDKECRQYIDKYIEQVFSFIQNIDPKNYCQSISLCSQSSQKLPTARNQLAHLPTLADFQNFGIEASVMIGEKPKKAGPASKAESSSSELTGPNCMFCKTIVKELFHFLRENKTEANIIVGLERICSVIYSPGEKRQQCDGMVKAYTRELVQLLIDETDPEMICIILEQCAMSNEIPAYSNSEARTLIAVENRDTFELADLITALDETIKYKSAEACFECKLFLKFIREKMNEPKTQEEIKHWLLDNLCASLPSRDLVESCTSMINKNAITFFQAVAGIMDPKQACRELGVCQALSLYSVFDFDSSSQRSVPTTLVQRDESEIRKRISNRPNELRGQMCDDCVQIITKIDDYISKHPVDQDVSVIVDEVCNNLPEGQVRNECTYIVKLFGAEIVEAVSSMENPRQLCTKVYLCSGSQV